MKALSSCLLALSLLGGSSFAHSQPKGLTKETERALWFADRHALLQLSEQIRQEPGWDEDGVFLRRLLRSEAMKSPVGHKNGTTQQAHAEWVRLTKAWTEKHPESALMHFVHIEALIGQGFYFRGTTYANEVTDQGWINFKNSLAQAAEYAKKHESVLASDPDGYVALIDLGTYMDVEPETLMDLARRGAALNSDDHGAYHVVIKGLTPRWGGNAALVERWINEAVDKTEKTWGLSLYATLYTRAAELEWGAGIFKNSFARWHRMNQGFKDLTAKYPSPNNLNDWAYFACMAQDRPTFLDVVDRIGDRWRSARWGHAQQATLDGCRAWAMKG